MNEKIEKILDLLNEYKEKTNCKGVLFGLSGGKDSTIVAMLAKKVWGDNVLAVLMPNGVQSDISDSKEIAKTLNLRNMTVNIQNAFSDVIMGIETAETTIDPIVVTEKAKTNIAPRIRMLNLYALAQSIGYRVVGTGNASEWYLGWFTYFGDQCCDVAPILHLTKTEVVEIGLELAKEFGLDEKYIIKDPGDGLTGKSDEENFGFTYDDLDYYIMHGEVPSETTTPEALEKIKSMHNLTEFKRRMPYSLLHPFESNKKI